MKHDTALKKIIDHREDIFREVNDLFYKLDHKKRRLFPLTVYSYLMSDSYGELFIEEIKKYPLFSDKSSIAFGILEFMHRKTRPCKVKSIRMLKARNSLNLEERK